MRTNAELRSELKKLVLIMIVQDSDTLSEIETGIAGLVDEVYDDMEKELRRRDGNIFRLSDYQGKSPCSKTSSKTFST
jgi:hypothetical protein